jgi:hypothetical protein
LARSLHSERSDNLKRLIVSVIDRPIHRRKTKG